MLRVAYNGRAAENSTGAYERVQTRTLHVYFRARVRLPGPPARLIRPSSTSAEDTRSAVSKSEILERAADDLSETLRDPDPFPRPTPRNDDRSCELFGEASLKRPTDFPGFADRGANKDRRADLRVSEARGTSTFTFWHFACQDADYIGRSSATETLFLVRINPSFR